MTYFKTPISDAARRLSVFHKFLATCAIALSALSMSNPAQAQRVQPMSYELSPSGSHASTSLRIENSSKTDMTLEITASSIAVDDNGIETMSSAEDDFLIFPPQLILKAGKTQAIRVKYIGEPTIKESAPYRISIKQIPIDLSGSGRSGVGMVVNFHTLAHVAPEAAQVDLHVLRITPNGADKWDIAIENRGQKMGRLSQTTWKILNGGRTETLNLKEVADMTSKNLVMPGRTLNLTIPAISGFDPSTTTVQIDAKS